MIMPPRLRRRSWRAGLSRFNIGGIKMVSSRLRCADKRAGIIYRRHRFGLVDNQITADSEFNLTPSARWIHFPRHKIEDG